MTLRELQELEEVTSAANAPDELIQFVNSDTGERFLLNGETRKWCRLHPDGAQSEWTDLDPESPALR